MGWAKDYPHPTSPEKGEEPIELLARSLALTGLFLPLSGGLFTFDAFGILLGWFVALEIKDEVS